MADGGATWMKDPATGKRYAVKGTEVMGNHPGVKAARLVRPMGRVLDDMRQQTAETNQEHSAVFDAKGRLVGKVVRGEDTHVSIPVSRGAGLTLVHTHPPVERLEGQVVGKRTFSPPSRADVATFLFDSRLAESRILAPDGSSWRLVKPRGYRAPNLSAHEVRELHRDISDDIVLERKTPLFGLAFAKEHMTRLGARLGISIRHYAGRQVA